MPKKTPKKDPKGDTPPVPKYPEPAAEWCRADRGTAMTVDRMKGLLGWSNEGEGEPLFTDMLGEKVWLLNNTRNRPYSHALALTWAQEHLMRRWELNGQPLIIGKYGQTISCQHRGVGLVLAEQIRTMDGAGRWKKLWPGPVTMDTLVVFGIDESDRVVNTIDTGRRRSPADVIYRSDLFSGDGATVRKALGRILEGAVNFVWGRTRAGGDYVTYKTHAEIMDFIDRHPSLPKAARHIHDEWAGKKGASHYARPGVAAGLLYLMAASGSDPDKYGKAPKPAEKHLDMSKWDKACEFWVLLLKQSPDLRAVRDAIASIHDEDTGIGASQAELIGTVCKAWGKFAAGEKLKEQDLHLEYHTDGAGVCRLIDNPTVGGIDLGDDRDDGDDDGADSEIEGPGAGPDDEAEVEGRKEALLSAKALKKAMAAESVADQVAEVRLAYPDTFLIWKTGSGYTLWGSEAVAGGKALGLAPVLDGKVGLKRAAFPGSKLEEYVGKLKAEGYTVGIVATVDDVMTLTPAG